MRKISAFLIIIFSCITSLHAEATVEELKRQAYLVLPALHGWCSKEKAYAFIDLVMEVKPEVYVEIGVFGGRSLFPVASALKLCGKGIIIGIDPWDKFECIKYLDPKEDLVHFEWWGNLDLKSIYASYVSMLKRFNIEEYCRTMVSTSEKAAPEIDVIDILHMDGNHSRTASIQDVTLYLPKVRTGGYIWFNDSLAEVKQDAVELLLESCEVIKVIDNGNCILFKKR